MKSIVIKFGGSLMYKDGLQLNLPVLEKVKAWYKDNKSKYDKLCIVVGGGKLSREVVNEVDGHVKKDDDRHSIAMELTQTNAMILRGYLGDSSIVCPETLGDAYEALTDDFTKVIISGGLRRGWSTDMDASLFADVLELKKVYKLSNIDYVYDKDPFEFKNAKPILNTTWAKYKKHFGIGVNQKHKPNLHIPISAETTTFCENKGISFFVSGGSMFKTKWNLGRIFEAGTFIHP
ncbi:MAG TPA: hypothetical protein VHA74_00795 [Candidatus Dojkabacteria bacterium]|nr:hypothetical protein [Candidatus Dojkabacteria bacterium]